MYLHSLYRIYIKYNKIIKKEIAEEIAEENKTENKTENKQKTKQNQLPKINWGFQIIKQFLSCRIHRCNHDTQGNNTKNHVRIILSIRQGCMFLVQSFVFHQI